MSDDPNLNLGGALTKSGNGSIRYKYADSYYGVYSSLVKVSVRRGLPVDSLR